MKSIEVQRQRVLIVVIGLATAVIAYLDVQSSAGQTSAPRHGEATVERSAPAREAEAAIARTNLAGRIEAALGRDFAGIWFEPVTGRMHVGVTSTESRRRSEVAAERVGLAEIVVETPVRSTWAQLEAAQERWSHHLGDLLDRVEFSTSLGPDTNSVQIELGSAVPRSTRAAVEREATSDRVDVLVSTARQPRLLITTHARCKAFKTIMADCNPTIVSGVTIDPTGISNTCTAGPVAIPTDRTTKAKATETYLLTAGHCIKNYGGVGKEWNAASNEKVPIHAEIGKAVALLHGGTSASDLGVIEVTTKFWAEAKDPPVSPKIAEWKAAEETNPFAVVKLTPPVKTTQACYSGQASGTGCGEIVETGLTRLTESGATVEKLVKVKLDTGVKAIPGDSGAPWFSKSAPGSVQGIHIGGETNKAGESFAFFQPLGFSLEKLSQEEMSLELLTTKNEKRHDPVFWAATSPATIDGEATTVQVFQRSGRTVECEEATYESTAESDVTTLTISPTFSKCTASVVGAEFPATVKMNGCNYLLHFEASEVGGADAFSALADHKCPAGKEIEIDVYANHSNHTAGTVTCRYSLGESGNQGLSTVSLTNKAAGGEKAKNWIEAHLDLEGVDSKRTAGTALLCGAETDTAGTLEGSVALEGTTEGEEANAIRANTG